MSDRNERRYKRHKKHKMHKRHERHDGCTEYGCPSYIHEEVEVTVPCAVRAHVEVGEAKIKCMNSCVVTRNSRRTPGRPGAVSRFTVSQKMRVEIPMMFHCDYEVGEGHVHFDNRNDNCCDDGKHDHYSGEY
jgi:hypothetical protein